MPYRVRVLNAEFDAAIRDSKARYWRKTGGLMHRRVVATLGKLAQDPVHLAGSHPLHHNYSGLRSVEVFGAWRLLIKICEECQRNSQQAKWPLDCCDNPPGDLRQVNVLELVDYH